MTTPYYADDWVTIYHGDCRNVLPGLAGDVTITDPPFGVGLVTKRARNPGRSGSHAVGRASLLYADDPDEIRQLITEAIPLALGITDRGLIFCGGKMVVAYPQPAAMGTVWTPAGSGYSPWGFQCSQPILYYGADPYLADGAGNRPNGFQARGGPNEPVDHPCPKPLSWMSWAVNRASRPGETIIDPFAGSGTTLLAAKQDARRAIGIEIEEHYCEIAATRLAQGVLWEVAA